MSSSGIGTLTPLFIAFALLRLYNEFLLRYGELKAKNQKLEEENLRLRERLGITSVSEKHSEAMQDVLPTVHKYSSSKAKIDLFRSLFKGRKMFLPNAGKA